MNKGFSGLEWWWPEFPAATAAVLSMGASDTLLVVRSCVSRDLVWRNGPKQVVRARDSAKVEQEPRCLGTSHSFSLANAHADVRR